MAKKTGNSEKKDDGTAAWQKVAGQTRRLSAAQRNRHIEKPAVARGAAAKTQKAKKPATAATPRWPASQKTDSQKVASPAKPPQPMIDPKARRRLSRGRDPIDGTLDLHGMSLAQGEAALRGFVAYHRAQGHKWVLVITGKGVRGEGRLRAALPAWLATVPLVGQVVEFDQAAISHGGNGAFYLRLRRAKPAKSLKPESPA